MFSVLMFVYYLSFSGVFKEFLFFLIYMVLVLESFIFKLEYFLKLLSICIIFLIDEMFVSVVVMLLVYNSDLVLFFLIFMFLMFLFVFMDIVMILMVIKNK